MRKTLAFLLLLLLLPTLCACGRPAASAETPAPTMAVRPTPPPEITPYPTATPRPKEGPTVSRPYGEEAPLPGSLRYIPATPTPTPTPVPGTQPERRLRALMRSARFMAPPPC